MKPVYKCDYCNVTGTENFVRRHESECPDNPNLRTCCTCSNCDSIEMFGKFLKFHCNSGIRVPGGYIVERCSRYNKL